MLQELNTEGPKTTPLFEIVACKYPLTIVPMRTYENSKVLSQHSIAKRIPTPKTRLQLFLHSWAGASEYSPEYKEALTEYNTGFCNVVCIL